MRIAVVQYELRPVNSFEDFAERCAAFVNTAAAYKADFVLFPELFTMQLSTFGAVKWENIGRDLAKLTPRYIELFERLSRDNKIYVIAGSQFAEEQGKLFNISYFFNRDGSHEKQYKIHVTPAERESWDVQPGHKVQVFDTDCGKVAVLICYDIEFPELSRIAVGKGANVIFCPSNTDQRFGYLRVRHCSQARAIENQIYVALSGCVGNGPMGGFADLHYSQSAIFTPSDLPFAQDAVAAECAPNVEGMIVQDVDVSLLEKNKKSGSVRTWHDRRTELYQIRYHEESEELSV